MIVLVVIPRLAFRSQTRVVRFWYEESTTDPAPSRAGSQGRLRWAN
jgi:hypothetical protein